MLVGTVAGQTVSLLLSPVLTRLFTPAQFGYLSVYNAFLMVFGMVASLSLEVAIPICMDDEECADLLALNGLALLFTTSLVTLFACTVPEKTLDTLWVGSLASYRWLLPVGFACLGGYYIMVAVATRAGAFQEIARTRISQGISGPVSQIILGLLSAGTPGLVLGYVIGQSSGTLLLLSRVVLHKPEWLHGITWRGIVAMARRYSNFPLSRELGSRPRHGRRRHGPLCTVHRFLFARDRRFHVPVRPGDRPAFVHCQHIVAAGLYR